jgi:cobalamin biosynthesis Co2+ chelatase CbiK
VFLLGDDKGADTTEILARSLRECGVTQSAIQGLGSLPASALQAVHREVATVADRLLELDLGDILLSGWRKYTDLTKAAERTLASPGSEEVVVLATHHVVSTHHPSVDLLVDGTKVHTFVFELKVEFDLNGVVAVVRQGDLVALRCGECVVTATLTLEGTSLKRSRKARIELPLVVRLNRPISLTRMDHHLPAPRLDHSASLSQP